MVWGQGVREGTVGTSRQELLEAMEASSGRNFQEEFERWIVECGEAMLTLGNSCTGRTSPWIAQETSTEMLAQQSEVLCVP